MCTFSLSGRHPMVHCGNMFGLHNEGTEGNRVPLRTSLQDAFHVLLKVALTHLPLERVKPGQQWPLPFTIPDLWFNLTQQRPLSPKGFYSL